MRWASVLPVAVLMLAACGDGGEVSRAPGSETPKSVPQIGTYAEVPVDAPFCSFTAVGDEADGSGYVLVTKIGDNAYHGYVSLDGEVTRLTEVETSFGAGMETRRFVNDVESVELEAILLDRGVEGEKVMYSGSVRVIFPVEERAVKFAGGCRVTGAYDD